MSSPLVSTLSLLLALMRSFHELHDRKASLLGPVDIAADKTKGMAEVDVEASKIPLVASFLPFLRGRGC